jgi:hypothetical protein
MILAKQGISIDLPRGWEGRAFIPALPAAALTFPVLHAATFALPPDDSSFAGRLAEAMGPVGTLLSLVEYDPALARDALFREHHLPISMRLGDLSPAALQVRRAGHAGAQRFFSAAGRAFCLYVIVGSGGDATGSVRRLNEVLATLRIEPNASSDSEGQR